MPEQSEPNGFSRRRFLAAAGLGTGYSLIVRAPQSLAATPNAMDRIEAARQFEGLAPENTTKAGDEPNMHRVELETDLVVCGGGMAGVCAAIAAARRGTRVILIQDRSRLGGNGSSEIGMHILGADVSGGRPGWREGGLIEEFRLENAKWNPHSAWELWDLMLYDKCVSEPNLTLILDTAIYRAEMNEDGTIASIWARCDKTEHLYHISAQLFVDATGDSRLGLEAGAEFRVGRESFGTFQEPLADFDEIGMAMGSSILFTAREHDRPIPYRAPSWARKITEADLQFRSVASFEYGYWWIELGGIYDAIRENERLRFELLAIVLGVWDYIKNSGNHPDSENWALQTVGMVPGKRDSRRLMGDVTMTQNDLEAGWRNRSDGVAIGGWSFDDHPSRGFDATNERPARQILMDEPYNIVLGALYSKNIGNLMMAGRNISCSHVAFSSTRVMATCSVIGQAVGTAAALCVHNGIQPRELREDEDLVRTLQQQLLQDDQSIREVRNEDPDDLARKAEVRASSSIMDSEPAFILTGVTRDMPTVIENRWMGAMDDDGAWIELTWNEPQSIAHVQLVFDTGFHRPLTLTSQHRVRERMEIGPQPETVRDYTLTLVKADGTETVVAEEKDNYQRLRRHRFEAIEATALRLTIHATNGADEARLYELRCYATA